MKYTKEQCVKLLVEKSHTINKLPQKSNFTTEEVMAIKAFLGPWPRALEAAGLKPPAEISSSDKSREKRIRAKRKVNLMKKENKKRKGLNNEI